MPEGNTAKSNKSYYSNTHKNTEKHIKTHKSTQYTKKTGLTPVADLAFLTRRMRIIILQSPSLSSPLFPFLSSFLSLPFLLPFPFPSSNPARVTGERCKLHSGVSGGSPADVEFDAF